MDAKRTTTKDTIGTLSIIRFISVFSLITSEHRTLGFSGAAQTHANYATGNIIEKMLSPRPLQAFVRRRVPMCGRRLIFTRNQAATFIMQHYDWTEEPLSLKVDMDHGLRLLKLALFDEFSTPLDPPRTPPKRLTKICCASYSLSNGKRQNWSLLNPFNQFLLFTRRV